MKTLVRLVALMLLAVGVGEGLFAQQTSKQVKEKVVETYSRNSMTFFMGVAPGVNAAPANAATKINFSEKYFNHNLKNLDLQLPQEYKMMTFNKKRDYLRDLLTKQGIGRNMVAKWFNRQENGAMNLEYVHKCGLYNATDQDVKMAVAAKRGDAFLKDAGQNLISKSYVLILVPNDVKSKDDGKSRSWDCQYDLFFYQLVFTPDVVEKFYNVWPYDDDAEALRKTKVAAFDTLTFKFTDVYSASFQSANASEVITTSFKKPKTLEELLVVLDNRMYENATFALDKTQEDFRVKTKISRVSPLRAKIGKKEGLKCDQQFFVFQYVYNESTKKAVPVRQAVIRSTSDIADNRSVATGKTPESRFYQTYGGTIQEGMLLQQRLDFGISAIAGFESGGIGGGVLNFMFRTGPISKVTGLYLMLDLGFDSGIPTAGSFLTAGKKYNFTRYSFGLGKGMHFARIVELTPYIQYGIEQTKEKDKYNQVQTSLIKGGAMLGFNIMHNVSLLGQLNYYMPFGDVTVKDKNDTKISSTGQTWDNNFTDRKGSSFMIGLRVEF